MVLVQKWPFFPTFFFLGNVGQENVKIEIFFVLILRKIDQEYVFDDILERR